MISRLTRYTAVPFLALSLAACGGSAASSTPASPASASAAPSTSTGTASPSAASASASGTAGASSAPSTGSPSSAGSASATSASSSSGGSAAASAPAGGVTITLGSSGSEVQIHATELLAGNAGKTAAIEKTSKVSGSIVLDANDQPVPGSKLTIDMTSLASDRSIRDGFIQRTTLDTRAYPTATFVPKQVQGLSGSLLSSGQQTFKLIGDMTIKDVTKPLTWNVTATFNGQACSGTATTDFTLSDFGMSPPKAGPVIAVDNNMTADVSFQANRTA